MSEIPTIEKLIAEFTKQFGELSPSEELRLRIAFDAGAASVSTQIPRPYVDARMAAVAAGHIR